jgi:spermidine/putrescine transport system ATP-binding protein
MSLISLKEPEAFVYEVRKKVTNETEKNIVLNTFMKHFGINNALTFTSNLLEGKITDMDKDCARLTVKDGQVICLNNMDMKANVPVYFAIRPERLKLKPTPENGDSYLSASLKERTFIGSTLKTVVSLSNGREITINEPAAEKFIFPENQKAYVTWLPDSAVVIKS